MVAQITMCMAGVKCSMHLLIGKEVSNLKLFVNKRPAILSMCATSSELPSDISTMTVTVEKCSSSLLGGKLLLMFHPAEKRLSRKGAMEECPHKENTKCIK